MKITIGISSCLLGEEVRFDGGHKANAYIIKTLGNYFDFRPYCPELEIGLGVPRKPIRLIGTNASAVRCVSVDNEEEDYTEQLLLACDAQKPWQQELCGYILKRGSPSCGMERVKIWPLGSAEKKTEAAKKSGKNFMPQHDGVGVYASRLMENIPYLPFEEEGRLGDAVIRENFIQRVFVLARWRQMQAKGISVASLIDFHARHKLIIMSHEQNSYRALGRLVAATTGDSLEQNAEKYLLDLMETLRKKTSRGNHLNVLQHIQGYLRPNIDAADKAELKETFEKYYREEVPLIVPITLLNHFFRKFPREYISRSWYMQPYPAEMSLQNQI